MSPYVSPRRDPTPGRKDSVEPPRFDGYPYLISRIGGRALLHIALVPADWSRERIVALSMAQADANRFETAACFAPDDAIHVAFDASKTWSGPTPLGHYVEGRLHLAEPIPQGEELASRLAWYAAFDRATRGGGYMVGDGMEAGELACPEDRRRLGGRGSDGLPSGLRRCERCGGAAGDYLRGGTEIVRCWCACENHNRCARCLLPLRGRRLSAWFWSDEDDSVWYLAAYAALSHRCPDETDLLG